MSAQMIEEATRRRIGDYWSKDAPRPASTGLRLRWWQSPTIVRHINLRVCGLPVDGVSQGLIEVAKKSLGHRAPLTSGISVGCGNAKKELTLIQQGIVSHFDLFELAESQIVEAQQNAREIGLADRIRIVNGDAFEIVKSEEQYDLVHWNNALHHIFDVDEAVRWSKNVLKRGGLFYMDDFVGPTRFQWSELSLSIASHIRLLLDKRFLVDPEQPECHLSTNIHRPDPDVLRAEDPSEAADSANILASVRRYFPDAQITATGGVVYNLALNDILNNFNEAQDRTVLELLMLIDDFCTDLIETHYATALAYKV